MSTSRTFPADAASAPAARRFVLGAVGRLPPEVGESVALMVSELATNAILHGQTDFEIEVEQAEDSLFVAVTDGGRGSPEVQQPAVTEMHGRGLMIVQSLADDWGVTAASGGVGKTVWFRLRLQPTMPTASGRGRPRA
jgi:anti-sigma regulatory factor (Ser/Thr protein kinase)